MPSCLRPFSHHILTGVTARLHPRRWQVSISRRSWPDAASKTLLEVSRAVNASRAAPVTPSKPYPEPDPANRRHSSRARCESPPVTA